PGHAYSPVLHPAACPPSSAPISIPPRLSEDSATHPDCLSTPLNHTHRENLRKTSPVPATHPYKCAPRLTPGILQGTPRATAQTPPPDTPPRSPPTPT